MDSIDVVGWTKCRCKWKCRRRCSRVKRSAWEDQPHVSGALFQARDDCAALRRHPWRYRYHYHSCYIEHSDTLLPMLKSSTIKVKKHIVGSVVTVCSRNTCNGGPEKSDSQQRIRSTESSFSAHPKVDHRLSRPDLVIERSIYQLSALLFRSC